MSSVTLPVTRSDHRSGGTKTQVRSFTSASSCYRTWSLGSLLRGLEIRMREWGRGHPRCKEISGLQLLQSLAFFTAEAADIVPLNCNWLFAPHGQKDIGSNALYFCLGPKIGEEAIHFHLTNNERELFQGLQVGIGEPGGDNARKNRTVLLIDFRTLHRNANRAAAVAVSKLRRSGRGLIFSPNLALRITAGNHSRTAG